MRFAIERHFLKFNTLGVDIQLTDEFKINLPKDNLHSQFLNGKKHVPIINNDDVTIDNGMVDLQSYLHIINGLDYKAIFPDFENLIALSSIYLAGKCHLIGDYSPNGEELKVLIAADQDEFNVILCENRHLSQCIRYFEWGGELKLDDITFTTLEAPTKRAFLN